jgi:redox-sensitive bicupin YhaK (pirin superfamily)
MDRATASLRRHLVDVLDLDLASATVTPEPHALAATFQQPVPPGFNGFCYVYKGAGLLGKDRIPVQEGQAAILDNAGGAFDFATTVSAACIGFAPQAHV